MERTRNIFETTDLYLAAALKTHGFKLIDLQRNNGRGVFIFEDRPDRNRFVRDYFSGDLTGSLKAFSNAWSDLKALVNATDRDQWTKDKLSGGNR